MTAILAYREGKSAWIGGDGEISDGDTRVSSPDPKVWKPRPGLLTGASGGLAWCDKVAWFDWPSPAVLTDAWIRKQMIQRLRSGLTDADLGEDDSEDSAAPEAIVIARDRTYTVTPRGVYLVMDPWMAVGSGAREAMSACAGAKSLRGARRVRAALEIAGRYAVGTGPPYTVLRA